MHASIETSWSTELLLESLVDSIKDRAASVDVFMMSSLLSKAEKSELAMYINSS